MADKEKEHKKDYLYAVEYIVAPADEEEE